MRYLPLLLGVLCACGPKPGDQPDTPSGSLTAISASASSISAEGPASIVFSWTSSASGDDLTFEVVFDKQDGNFSKPVYAAKSNQSMARSMTLAYGALNSIAGMAGIPEEGRGTLSWTVRMTQSGSVTLFQPAGKIEVVRSKSSSGGGTTPLPTVSHKERALQTFSAIKSQYGLSNGLLRETPGGHTSYLWPYDGFISGLALLNKLGCQVDYPASVGRYQRYWSTSTAGIGGYSSSTNGSSGYGERYYDDNSIVGLNLLEAWRQTGDSQLLTYCKNIVTFLRSGEDDIFDGGLWWCEQFKNQLGKDGSNKPCCANGYACWFLLSYYQVCPEAEKADVLSFAKRLYDFLYNTLRDSDGLYWNSKEADGSINTVKWTYNTGAMIANGVLLYEITRDGNYLSAAKKSASAAAGAFIKGLPEAGMGYPDHDPWFNVKLLRAFMVLEPHYPACKGFIETFASNIDYAWDHARNSDGLFKEDWTGQKTRADRDKTLLMQDAFMEAFGAIAVYNQET